MESLLGLLAACSAIPAVSVFVFYIYRKFYCHRFFKRLGIPGPPPHFFYGNLLDIWRPDRHLVTQKWAEEYGEIFGIYEGSNPVLMIAGLEGAEQVCIKQSGSFGGRYVVCVQPDERSQANDPWCNMFLSGGDHWRRPRAAASPFFTAKRVAQMSPCLDTTTSKFIEILPEIDGATVTKDGVIIAKSFRKTCQRFALQYLGEIAFSLDLRLLDKPSSDIAKKSGEIVFESCQEMFGTIANDMPWVFKMVTALPILAALVRFGIRCYPTSLMPTTTPVISKQGGLFGTLNTLMQMMASVIFSRRIATEKSDLGGLILQDQNARNRDMVQLLSDTFINVQEKGEDGKMTLTKKPFLTDQQLLLNMTGFLMAGYETSGTTLSMLFYLLATHQEIQEKLFAEIQSVLSQENGEEKLKSYETLMTEMKYLDAVVNEAIRLYTIVPNTITRKMESDEVNICGYIIPKSVKMIQVDTYSIHQRNDIWGPVDSKLFCPERFLDDYPTASSRPENAFLAFGAGPRQCLGIRFVLFEIKYLVVQLLRWYHLAPIDENAPKEVPVKVDNMFMVPLMDLSLKLEPRMSTTRTKPPVRSRATLSEQ